MESPAVDLELVEGNAVDFEEASATVTPRPDVWYQRRQLDDGSIYLRWHGLFEFVVAADGRRITARLLGPTRPESFLTYTLGQVLCFALLARGREPLHSTAVVVEGGAIGFAADSGGGKSTLAASFLAEGSRLLTDDLLVLAKGAQGLWAQPGYPRIKLFPSEARALLGSMADGVPMNPDTLKQVIPLEVDLTHPDASRLVRMYVLRETTQGSRRVTIRQLSGRSAFLELTRNTFNAAVTTPTRLKRQFQLASTVAQTVPVKSLSYPRDLAALPAVRSAILRDVAV